MQKITSAIWKPGIRTISLFLYFYGAGLIAAGLIGLFGERISITRILMLCISLLASSGFCFLAWKLQNDTGISVWWNKFDRKNLQNILIFSTLFLFFLSWSLVWTPLNAFGNLYYYIKAVFPFTIWLLIASGMGLWCSLASRYGFHIQQWKENIDQQNPTFKIAGAFLLIFALIAWIASSRIVGVMPADEDFWYGAGVPTLAFQVIGALIIGVGLSVLINRWLAHAPKQIISIDLLLFLMIWAASAYLWAIEPVKPDFLITQPVAPNFELYPDYDARNNDVMSQFAVIGQGINNHSFFDRVLYPAFLVYLHTFAGQNYSTLMAIQAAIFAILPAILFIIGATISDRTNGLVLGILTVFRGINQINIGNIIETAHQKQMLTEYPTAVLLVLATLLLIKWVKDPIKNWYLAGLSGGIIGISTLLRPHTMVIIPVFIVLAFFVYLRKPKIWISTSTFFFTAAILSVIPWAQFSGQNISIFDLYFTRINDVIKQRYQQDPKRGSYDSSSAKTVFSGTSHQAAYSQAPIADKNIVVFVGDNFLNNLVTTVQTLPTTPFNLDARTIVKKTENFWKPYWDGKLGGWAIVLIPFNLLIISLGLGAAWKYAKLAGFIPLIIMVSYYVINAFGRTSGGRYIVPVDWVILIYYVLGLITILKLVTSFYSEPIATIEYLPQTPAEGIRWWPIALIVLILSFSMGSLIPLSQTLNQQRFPDRSPDEQATIFTSITGDLPLLNENNIQNFLSSENAIILTGRSLYPRQFNINEGLDISVYRYYHSMPFPRTLFTTIGQQGERVVILPTTNPAPIPNSTDVMVIGCLDHGIVFARAIIRLDDNSIIEGLNSDEPLLCPLQKPICETNKNCR